MRPTDDENHLIAERRAKLAKLRERGNRVSERLSPQRAGGIC
jgi:hypothetical protein